MLIVWFSISRFGPLLARPLARCIVAATTTTSEPAWHRRARARRADARTLLRVAAAKRLLGQHHSAQQPLSAGMAPRFWCCHGRDCRDSTKQCGYMVPIGKVACDACGHMPPERISCPAKLKGGQAQRGLERQARAQGVGGGPRGQDDRRTSNESQLKAKLASSQAELVKTRHSLAEARKKVDAAASGNSLAVAAMAVDGSAESALEEGKAEVKSLRAHLKALRELPAELQSSPGIACEIVDWDCRLQAAILAQRGAKPLDVQLASSEAHLAAMQKLEAKACQKTTALREKQAQLVAELEEQLAAQSGAEAKTLAAKDEVAKIKAQTALSFAAEAGAAHAPDPAGIVVPPGCVSIQHAEAVLAEQLALRDAASVQAIAVAESASDELDDDVVSLAGSAAGASAAGSTAGEGAKKRARQQRALGARATIAHVRGHTFEKPRWG